jgi:PAS domain S-box-containing protein
LGFALAIAIMVAIAILSIVKLRDFAAEARWVEHTHDVIRALVQLRTSLTDAEAGERGYVITGTERFLDSFREAHLSVEAALASLDALVADNPVQEERLAELRLRVRDELDYFGNVVHMAQQGDREGARRAIASGRGIDKMSAVRARIGEMLEVEEDLLQRRSAKAEQGAATTRTVVVAGAILSLALLALAYIALRHEILRRAASEAAAHDSSVFLDRMFEAVPHILYVKTVGEFRYLRINRAHEAMFEIPREQVIGRRDDELFAPEQAAGIAAEDQATLAGSGVNEYDVDQLVSAKHGVRTLHKKKVIITDSRGEPMYLLGVAEDVTEHKAAQREIARLNVALERRARELEITNKELESFTYSVSHDLRAPLRAINGFALMLGEDYEDKLDDEGRRLLGVIRSNAQRMGALIDDLLAFSRIGRATLNRVDVDMNALVATVLREISEPADVDMPTCDVGPLPAASGDPALLKQVWTNLVSNAVKYSSKNQAPRVQVAGERIDGECVYRVVDNGAGFDMRYADKLFGVFQRLHRAEEFPGTGVGLAIVQRIVVRHGGRVWAEGKVNEGATFGFALPDEESVHG